MMIGAKRLVLAAVLIGVAAACGGEAPAGGGGGGGGEASALASSVEVTSDDERTLHPLQAGRYRLSWQAADCEDVHLVITKEDGTVVYDNSSPSIRVLFVQGITDGRYYVEQTEESCADWSMELVRI